MTSFWHLDTPVGLTLFAAGRLVFGLAAAIHGPRIVDAKHDDLTQTGLASGAGIPDPFARDYPAEPGGIGGGPSVSGVAYPDARRLTRVPDSLWTRARGSGTFRRSCCLFLGGLHVTHATLGVVCFDRHLGSGRRDLAWGGSPEGRGPIGRPRGSGYGTWIRRLPGCGS